MKKTRRKQARKVLLETLGRSIGYNVAAHVPYVTGPLPWRPELERHRPWTPADTGAARLWLEVPAGENLVRNVLDVLAKRNRYLPADAPTPVAPARLIADGARWCWEAKCPYCHEWHRHAIVGYWDQLQPQRALGFRQHPCDAPVRGARGYILEELAEPARLTPFLTERIFALPIFCAKATVRIVTAASA